MTILGARHAAADPDHSGDGAEEWDGLHRREVDLIPERAHPEAARHRRIAKGGATERADEAREVQPSRTDIAGAPANPGDGLGQHARQSRARVGFARERMEQMTVRDEDAELLTQPRECALQAGLLHL